MRVVHHIILLEEDVMCLHICKKMNGIRLEETDNVLFHVYPETIRIRDRTTIPALPQQAECQGSPFERNSRWSVNVRDEHLAIKVSGDSELAHLQLLQISFKCQRTLDRFQFRSLGK